MAHLPVRYKLASTFHRKAIAKLAPQLSSIVWDKTNLPMHRGLSLAQRYPAMASRFGRNHWGKKATPMFNFEQWLSSLPIAVTRDTLAAMQCLPDQPNASFWQSVKQNSVLAGFSSVWSTLNTHETQAVRKSA
jgi:asparagine synthase (glutamine-hydrolysing)